MSEAKHTPGPWCLMQSHGVIDLKGNNGNTLIATWDISPDGIAAGSLSEEEQANLCLIASVPKLLEALKQAKDAMQINCGWSEHSLRTVKAEDYSTGIYLEAWRKAEAAIAEALGKGGE